MRSLWLGFGLALSLGTALASGCAASDDGSSSSGGGGSGATGGAGSGGKDASSGGTGLGGTGGGIDAPVNSDSPADACAELQVEAKQAPAALLVVIDTSSSMAESGKWTAAQLSIVQAIDSNSFDNLSLGLLAYPSGDVPGPACVFGLPVGCAVSALPQVPLADTGTAKSNTPGVRQSVYNWLSANSPTGSGTPGYDALKAAIDGMKIYSLPAGGVRAVILITDGGFGCTSLSNPQRPAYTDQLGCPDWENPGNVVSMLTGAYGDATTPVRTFVIGVPGSDTDGSNPNDPPYHVRLALSAFAKAGSPDLVPAGCDGDYLQTSGDPATPCHFDLTQGTFDAQALAKALSDIRGKVLGCAYQLPDPGPGKTIDKKKVNVVVTLNGTPTTIPQRSDPNDTCANAPCWDYDANGQVVLIGAGCDEVKNSTDVKVEIQVGCQTIIK